MAQTVILTPTTAAGNTTDIVVAAAASVTIAAYATDAGGISANFQAFVKQKMPDGQYQQLFAGSRKEVTLTQDWRQVVLTAPGTYRVEKGVTFNTIGISQDA